MFDEIVVIDYVTNINSLTSDQKTSLYKSVINPFFLDNCPDGTIIGKPVSGEDNLQNRVYYPFFSHVRFPVKAGERAWAFTQGSGLVSYWMTRKVQDTSAEDINFTHFDREKIYSRIKNTIDARKSNSEKFPDSNSSGINLKNTRKDAISRSEFSGEPVVAIKNKSVDLTIQGSNGTAIKMSSDGGAGYGTIDIVAGPATNNDLVSLAGLTVLNTEGYQETIKPPVSTDLNSLTIGALRADDESRITVSRSFDPDSYYNIQIGTNDGTEAATIALKSEKIRLKAETDLKISAENGSGVGIFLDGSTISLTSSTGETSTDILVESSSGFQSQLAAALTEISTALQAFGIPTPNTLSLISLLQSKTFSSRITRSD